MSVAEVEEIEDGYAGGYAEERRRLEKAWALSSGFFGWFMEVSHTVIGKRYIATAMILFLLGGIEALLMRIQLARPENGFLDPDLYDEIFTTHGSTMMFLFGVPVFQGLAIYLVPLMLGTRNTAFPRLNALSYCPGHVAQPDPPFRLGDAGDRGHGGLRDAGGDAREHAAGHGPAGRHSPPAPLTLPSPGGRGGGKLELDKQLTPTHLTLSLRERARVRARGGHDAPGLPSRIPGAAAFVLPLLFALALPALAAPFAYVSNERAGTVTVIDTATDKPVATLRVGTGPRGIHVSPDGKRVYVALSDTARNSRSAADAIAVIDAASRKIVARHGAGSDPEQFAVSRDGGRLYASNEDAGTATVTDLKTGKVLATLIVGIEPEGVAISPDGRWVYVTAETSNTVSVIDTRKNQVVASFLVDPRPRAAAFSPDGQRAWVTAEIGGSVSMVDAARHQVVRTIPIPRSKPVGVVVSPDGKWVYVANGHGHSVAVIDAAAGKVVTNVPVGKRPWGIAVSKDGRKVYTANGVSNDVSVIDARTRKVIATIPAGPGAWGVAISP